MTSKSAAEPISGGTPETPAATTPAQPQQSLDLTEAETEFKKGNFAGAVKALQEAGKKDPDQPPAQVLMSQMFLQAKMKPEIRKALEQAVTEAPTDPEAYMILGDIALGERHITEAQLLYQKANDLMGEFNKSTKRKAFLQPRILYGLAEVAISHKDWAGTKASGSLVETRSDEHDGDADAGRLLVRAEECARGVGKAQEVAKIIRNY